MATTRPRWPLILAGVAVVVAVVAIALAVVGTMFFRDNVQVARGASQNDARLAFEQAKRAFADPRPLLMMGDDGSPAYAPGIDTRRNPGTVTSVQILAWGAQEDTLATVTLPAWLLRLKSGPIRFGQYASGMDEHVVQLDPKDFDRYGPGVVLEIKAPNGDRVLLIAQ